ncbi:MAG: acylneuraminate cytidylyltransferase [Methanosarcinales archaeon]|nr:acylneuraminate cytidylyltransferase [Methanosarcinales archaeon]
MILGILQARTSSTRLPRKVVMTIRGKSLLEYQIERIKLSEKIDKLVIATSTNSEDDIIVKIAKKCEVDYYRGDLNNVLERFYGVCKKYNPNAIVRLTGDCPLIDCQIIDDIIAIYKKNRNYDLVVNTFNRTFPDGMDVELLSLDAFEQIYKNSKTKEEKEHVTHYIYTNPSNFKVFNYSYRSDFSHLRLTVDEIEDFELVSKIYRYFLPRIDFSWLDIISLLTEHPELLFKNRFLIK